MTADKICETEVLREIPITSIEGVKIGHAQDQEAATGCTVILCPEGAVTGVDVRGGAPASRELALLDPLADNSGVHAVLLSGGSAFGLDAAGGVMAYLEERSVGFPVGCTVVPIVCASCLFDLQVGSHRVRPDRAMGYAACLDAERNAPGRENLDAERNAPGRENMDAERNAPGQGNVGAGTGATVGKLMGMAGMMKSGIGMYAVQLGDLQLGAVVAVNAVGDVYDAATNRKLAGLLDPETGRFLDSEEAYYRQYVRDGVKNLFTGNTTIGAVITNGAFTKTQLTKIAGMAHDGYARSIRPVHTTADGDTIYAMSTGKVRADLNVAGTLAARAVAEAVKRAVLCAEGAYGLKAARDMEEYAQKNGGMDV